MAGARGGDGSGRAASPLDVAFLQAGALLPAGTALPEGEPAEVADARRYRHPALAGRAVVRLSPRALAPADDTEMEVLGFGAPEVTPGLGLTRPRALGFPGWALVHDPAHARHALAVMKEFKVQAKLARSKPGHAKDGFDAIAGGLARSVPHFLPSFHEEAGRAFLESGNRTYAATAFAKAREAERVHALAVDPALRDRAFLEFALAGAVSGKALSEYAQELAEAADHADAYVRFRDLCVRRTLGGMPPWTGMARDLRRLGKLAAVAQEDEDDRLVRQLLEAPALLHAAGEFWTAFGPALERLCRAEPAVRASLLRLLPEPPSDRAAFVTAWLELLERCGALEALVLPRMQLAPEALPPDGAAAWLSRLISHSHGGRSEVPDAVFALARRMAPRLREEGRPVSLAGRWGGFDLDLFDLLCELEVPVADPGERTWMRLEQWIKGEPGSTERPRDPIHAIRDPRYRPAIEAAVGAAMAKPGFDAEARRKRGLAEARRSWVLGQLELLGTGTLPAAVEAFDALSAAATARTFADLPEAWQALGRLDLAQPLARTLRGGLLDELGWPALEAAVAELTPQGGLLTLHGAFPYAILHAGLKVVVVGPTGRALEHELRLPKGGKLHLLAYAQGQLLVAWNAPPDGLKAYWSGAPAEDFELPWSYAWRSADRTELELPDGSLLGGARALHAGDRTLPEGGRVLSDGETVWTLKDGALRELDPRTGALGRKSLPRFLEEYVKDGFELDVTSSQLLPLPAAARGVNPLGARDGLFGLRVRTARDGTVEAESIDGQRVVLPAGARTRGRASSVAGLLRLPGREAPLVVQTSYNGLALAEPGGPPVAMLEPGRTRPRMAAGTPLTVPPPFLLLFSVRDEAGSRALRGAGAEQARRLLDAARRDVAAEQEALPRTREALARELPKVRHAGLAEGVAGLARVTAVLEARLASQRAAWDPSKAPAEAGQRLDVGALRTALDPLVERRWYDGGQEEGDLGGEIAAAGEFMAAPPPAEAVPLWKRALGAVGLQAGAAEEKIVKAPPGGGFRWEMLAGHTGALAFMAASPLRLAAERAALVGFLEAWKGTPFVGSAGQLRRCLAAFPPGSPYTPVSRSAHCHLVARGAGRWLVRPRQGWSSDDDRRHHLLEAAPGGVFQLLPGATLAREEAIDDRPWTAERLGVFLEALARRGPAPLAEEAVEALSRRTGLTRAEAALLWSGLPALGKHEHDFLGKERREALGLKAAEAKVARDALDKVPEATLRAVLDAAMAGDPEAPWRPLGAGPEDEASPVARAAEAWNRLVGRRAPIPPDLLVRCARELPRGVDPAAFLAGLAQCGQAPAWTHDGEWALEEGGVKRTAPAGEEEVFGGVVMLATARYVPFLFEALPVGDPLRARLPEVIRLSRQRLANPGLLVLAGTHYLDPTDRDKGGPAFLDAVGAAPYPPGGDRAQGRDGGLVLARLGGYSAAIAFRPARLGPEPEPSSALVEGLAPVAAARALRSEPFERLARRVAETPVPAGGYEANPLLSAAPLVATVAAARGLSEEAAALYLQLLALRAPTSRAVQAWNGWTAARHKKAAAELAAKKLVLVAKRARAGREHFLPGGWEEAKAPDLPLETWKLPLYGTRHGEGGFARPLGLLLPLRPIHELFEAAWARIEAGDAPRYEEVT